MKIIYQLKLFLQISNQSKLFLQISNQPKLFLQISNQLKLFLQMSIQLSPQKLPLSPKMKSNKFHYKIKRINRYLQPWLKNQKITRPKKKSIMWMNYIQCPLLKNSTRKFRNLVLLITNIFLRERITISFGRFFKKSMNYQIIKVY